MTGGNPSDKKDDEIHDYIDGRWITASEAHWLINQFKVHDIYPTVKALSVTFKESDKLIHTTTGAESTRVPDVKRYYERPIGEDFDALLFEDYMTQYILHDSKPPTQQEAIKDGCGLYVTRRKRGKAICRYHVLLPSAGELYYFQMIVKHMPLRSPQDGLIDNEGTTHPTYQAAALALGLYQKETEYESAFAAIVNNFPPYILRSFLVQISIEGAQGHAIMQTHYRQLADDIPGNDSNLQAAKLLQKIHAAFQIRGRTHVTTDSQTPRSLTTRCMAFSMSQTKTRNGLTWQKDSALSNLELLPSASKP